MKIKVFCFYFTTDILYFYTYKKDNNLLNNVFVIIATILCICNLIVKILIQNIKIIYQ